jgi:TolB-like protein/DNA-binding winged helix-turn-helix (wHTH) protein/Tfp pilus assembly protein PilF
MSPDPPPDSAVLRVGKWRVDPALDEISSEGRAVRVEPLLMRLLVCLARHAGRPVELRQLLDEVWTGVIVSQGSVYQAIAQLRRALGDDCDRPAYIDTVPRKGYRLIAPVEAWDSGDSGTMSAGAYANWNQALPDAAKRTADTTRRGVTARTALIGVCALIVALIVVLALSRSPQAPGDHATTAAFSEKSIAVLPFTDMSEKQNKEYFANGLAEELTDILTKIPNLKVVARTSSSHFKGKDTSIADVGKKLDVAYVLTGSVREADQRLRITTQLIRTSTGQSIWSKSYERDTKDIFKIQDDVAGEVIQALRVVLADAGRIQSNATSWDAYQAYLEGQYLRYTWATANDLDKAVAAYRAALLIDSNFAPSWAGLSNTLRYRSEFFGAGVDKDLEDAREAAFHAVALNPNLADAYVATAYVYSNYGWNWGQAAQAAATAQRLEPGNVDALFAARRIAQILGEWQKALELERRAEALDPLNPVSHFSLGSTLYCLGDLKQSESEYRRALQLLPRGGEVQALLARNLMLQGRLQEALEVAVQEPVAGYRLWAVAMAQHAMARDQDAERTIADFKRISIGNEDGIAYVYGFERRLDEAFEWFGRAYERRNAGLMFMKCQPESPQLTRDPRYKALLHKVNLPE